MEKEPSTKSGDMSVTPEAVRAKMQIPDNLQDAYQRIIIAAKKVLYSDVMKPQVKQLLASKMTVGQKLGRGVIALFAILRTESNNTLPPQLIIPCATEMVAEAADLLRKAGMNVTDQDIAEGMFVMVSETLYRAKVPLSKLPQMVQGMNQPQSEA